MKIIAIAAILAAASAAYLFYTTRPGPAEQAGAVIDTVVDKTKRIVDVVTD